MLPFMLNKVVRGLNANLDRVLSEHGLSTPQWRVLATLAWTRFRRPGEIADFTAIDASTLTRILDRLCDAGLIARRKLPRSGRASEIEITTRGRDTLQTARGIVEAQERAFSDRLSVREIKDLNRTLRKLYRPEKASGRDLPEAPLPIGPGQAIDALTLNAGGRGRASSTR